MSRREMAVNALLGALLLTVFGLLVLACVLPILLLYSFLVPLVERAIAFFGLPLEFWYFALLCTFALGCAVRCARNRYWPNAFLALATLPMAGVALFVGGPLSGSTWPFVGSMLLIFALPDSQRLPFWQFTYGAAIVSTGFLVNAGMFGQGGLARAFSDILFLLIAVWLWRYARVDRNEPLTLSGSTA